MLSVDAIMAVVGAFPACLLMCMGKQTVKTVLIVMVLAIGVKATR
jgi:uncharacterized membrane protein